MLMAAINRHLASGHARTHDVPESLYGNESGVLMRRIKIVVVTAVLALAAVAGWRVGSCELANFQLQEDLHDMAAEAGARYGYTVARSDDDFRQSVIRKAKEYGIELKPN